MSKDELWTLLVDQARQEARQQVWVYVAECLCIRLRHVEEYRELPVIRRELEVWLRWCREQAKMAAKKNTPAEKGGKKC